MTNPYQPPSSGTAPNQRLATFLRPSVWVACYYLVFVILFSQSFVAGAFTSWQPRKLIPAIVALYCAYMAYGIFTKDRKARKNAIGFSRFASIGTALVGLYMCSLSKLPGVNIFWFTINPTTVVHLLALTAAGVLVVAIPGLLLVSPAAKREFSDG